jgi:hypothetical protein
MVSDRKAWQTPLVVEHEPEVHAAFKKLDATDLPIPFHRRLQRFADLSKLPQPSTDAATQRPQASISTVPLNVRYLT